MALEELKGLTALDRANWEEKYKKQILGKDLETIDKAYRNMMFKKMFGSREDYSTLKNMSAEEKVAYYNKHVDSLLTIQSLGLTSDQLNSDIKPLLDLDKYKRLSLEIYENPVVESDVTQVDVSIKYDKSPEEMEAYKLKSLAFDLAMRDYSQDYAKNALNRDTAIKDIRKIAELISPYYKKYKGTSYLPFTSVDWQNMAINYYSRKDAYGEEDANYWLLGKILDTASENQSMLEKGVRSLYGLGASAAGALVSTYGMIYGTLNYLTGQSLDIEGLSGFDNFLNAVMDNNITRYGNDIAQYGTIFDLDEWKLAGLSKQEIIQTLGLQTGSDSLFDLIFNVNTIPLALQSGGFTLASMMTGIAEAKIALGIFSGLRGLTLSSKINNTTLLLLRSKQLLESLKKAENFTNKFIIPGVNGTTEGVIEGLNTKIQALEDARKTIAEEQAKYVDKYFNLLLEKNPDIDPNILYKMAWDSYTPSYEAALKQAEFVGAKAGINNFLANSIINGIINQTFKAALLAPSVQGALQNSRLFNWVNPKGKFNITGEGKNISVTPHISKSKLVLSILKEPFGEFSEEYLQSVADATMSGGAANNIHKFIENKYSGDGSAQIGDYMAGDVTAALKAMGESMIDNETIKSGIYGAISSALGTPVVRGRDYTKQVLGPDGKYHTKLDLSRRLGESRLSHITRLMPWRSGLVDAIRETNQYKNGLYDEAKALEDWLKDPKNKAKFDGIVGTYNWAKLMDSDARSNDEFGYRNSLLGKTINDAFMLEKLKGTAFYDSYMKEVIEAANLERDSELALKFIKALRDNIETSDDKLTDDLLLELLKSNANKILSTIQTIQDLSDKIDRTLGNVDEDTKQALIFGQMSIDDWEKRSADLEKELHDISNEINSDVSASNINPEIISIISKYGSLKNALKKKEELTKLEDELKKDINNLNNRKGKLSETEKTKLKEKKVKVKALNKVLESFKNIENILEEDAILNENDIMSLPPVERAIMLDENNLSKYSDKQQEIIKNLNNKGVAKDINFKSKILDAGRIDISYKAFLNQYNAILKDPESFNKYVQKAKLDAADVLTKKKYESISTIDNYLDFAVAMDKLMDNSSERQQRLILNALDKSNNINFKKYKESRKKLEDLFNLLINDKTFKNIDPNDADLFTLSLQYLSNKDIDLTDETAIVNALSQTDSEGNSLFHKYIDSINESSLEETKVLFTSIGEIIQTYKDIMNNYLKDEKEKKENELPVKPKETTSAQSAPILPPTPSLFANSPHTMEELAKEEKKTAEDNTDKVKKEEKEVQKELPKDDQSSILELFELNSNIEVAESAELGQKVIANSSSSYSEEAKNKAQSILNDFSKNEFANSEELVDALVKAATNIDMKSEGSDLDTLVSSLLRTAASKILNKTLLKKEKEKEEKERELLKTLKDALEKKDSEKPKSILNNKANSSIIETSNIQWFKENYPDSPIVKYWERYKIEEYLSSSKLLIGKNGSKIYFITDEVLTKEVLEDMKKNGALYTDYDIPIIGVVKDSNGPIVIDGVHYQPVGTFPSTNNMHYSGVSNIGRVRDLAKNLKPNLLITDDKGNVLVGSTISIVSSTVERVSSTEVNEQLLNLFFKDFLNKEEQKALKVIPKKDRKDNSLYKALRLAFKRMLKWENATSNSKGFYYFDVPNLKGQVYKRRIFYRSISNTLSTLSNKSIAELFNNNEIDELLLANSRFIKSSKIISDFIDSLPTSFTFNTKDGLLIPLGESALILNSLALLLIKELNRHFSLPGGNWRYELNLSNQTKEDVQGNIKREVSINLTDGNSIIPITTVFSGESSKEATFNFLKNLIMDGTSVRKSGTYDFIKWHVDEPKRDLTLADVESNIIRAFDDGILEISYKGIRYKPEMVTVRSPFTKDGKTNTTLVSNPSNATPSKPVNTPSIIANNLVQAGAAIIDSSTGTIIQGEESKPSNTKLETAKLAVDLMKQDSLVIQLSEDGKEYINTKIGKRYTKISTILKDTSKEGQYLKPVANGVLDFIKDFFNGEFHTDNKLRTDYNYNYPNASLNAWGNLARLLDKFNNSLRSKGITLVKDSIIVNGTLTAINTNGSSNNLDLADSLLFLGYDKDGNFYVYSIEILDDAAPILTNTGRLQYTKLLSLYLKFLENTYGIKVKELNVLPIKVNYLESKDVITVLNNQIFINDKEYTDANPKMLDIVALLHQDPNIELNRKEEVKQDSNKSAYTKEELEILAKASRDSQGKLLAPNGKVSNLTEKLYVLVRTKTFKDWFGDWENNQEQASQVVDENGEPLVVYHGSPITNIEVFSNKKKRYNIHKDGIFFSQFKDHAAKYATKEGEIYSVFLNIRNLGHTKMSTTETLSDLRDRENTIIENLSYDGGKFETFDKEGKTIQYFVRKSNQIKSAIGNTGVFSSNNDNIYDKVKLALSSSASVDILDSLTQEAKEDKSKVEKLEVKDLNSIVKDSNTGLNKRVGKDRRRKAGNKGKIQKAPLRPIPKRLAWGVWENFITDDGESLWNEETIKALESIGYTEELWNQLSDEEMKHELNCKGVKAIF